MYSTPFIIWTNYPSESVDMGYVSLNYLSSVAKQQAGLPLTEFDGFLLDAYKKYPVISANIIQNNEGEAFMNRDELNDEILDKYEILQYYYLFDN